MYLKVASGVLFIATEDCKTFIEISKLLLQKIQKYTVIVGVHQHHSQVETLAENHP